MSIRAMTIVMDMCVYDGGVLMTLLMMADHGDDQGCNVFPQIDLLAAKTRMSDRNVRGCIRELRNDGTVILLDDAGNDLPSEAIHQGGRGRWPQYRIDLERLKELQGLHTQADPSCVWCEARAKRRKNRALKAEKYDTKGGKIEHHIKKEPSLTVNDPSAPDGAVPAEGDGKTKMIKIGDWRPGQHDVELAVAYWSQHGRPDLCARIETVMDHFCAHHASVGTRRDNWSKSWRTWYVNQLNHHPIWVTAPPRVATVAGVTIDQWVYRLQAWHIGIPDDGVSLEVPKGFWDKRWGEKPPKAPIPPEAVTAFNRRFPAGRVAAK